jgi:hypothetical protein
MRHSAATAGTPAFPRGKLHDGPRRRMMLTQAAHTVAGLAVLLATAPGLSAAVDVQAVRVGLDPDHARLVLESDRPIRARMERDPQTGVLAIDGIELEHLRRDRRRRGQLHSRDGATAVEPDR